MENKKGSLSTVFLVIAIILAIAIVALLFMKKIENDKTIADLGNQTSELQEKGDSISNTTKELEIKKFLSPSGFAGSSTIKVVLYSDNTVYVINYDGDGYEENNIVRKTLIARNADTIESNGEGQNFESIIVKGQEIEVIETTYNWIEFNSNNKSSSTNLTADNTNTIQYIEMTE